MKKGKGIVVKVLKSEKVFFKYKIFLFFLYELFGIKKLVWNILVLVRFVVYLGL